MAAAPYKLFIVATKKTIQVVSNFFYNRLFVCRTLSRKRNVSTMRNVIYPPTQTRRWWRQRLRHEICTGIFPAMFRWAIDCTLQISPASNYFCWLNYVAYDVMHGMGHYPAQVLVQLRSFALTLNPQSLVCIDAVVWRVSYLFMIWETLNCTIRRRYVIRLIWIETQKDVIHVRSYHR